VTCSNVPYRSGSLLFFLAFTLHTAGLIVRMVLDGRPPAVNLYSSTVLLGWGAGLLGVIAERSHRNGIGTVAGAVVGLVTLIVAHGLAPGDTMEGVRAGLNSNNWLAAHVVVMTIGCSAAIMAGVVAAGYVLSGVLTRRLSADIASALDRLVYRLVWLAMVVAGLGTILGGFWADRVWGRFWGWDPKETGALLIILWAAIYLTVRWNQLAGERVRMALAVAGPIVTSLSWFGVNMLGVGLHSYGFTNPAVGWLMLFTVSQLLVVALGVVPGRYWRSSVDRGLQQCLG